MRAEVLHLGERVAVRPALLLHPVERDHRACPIDAVQTVDVDRVRLGVADDREEAAGLLLGRRVGRLERDALVPHPGGAHALPLGLAVVVAEVDDRADAVIAEPLDALLVGLAAAIEAGRDLGGVVDAARHLDRPREAAPELGRDRRRPHLVGARSRVPHQPAEAGHVLGVDDAFGHPAALAGAVGVERELGAVEAPIRLQAEGAEPVVGVADAGPRASDGGLALLLRVAARLDQLHAPRLRDQLPQRSAVHAAADRLDDLAALAIEDRGVGELGGAAGGDDLIARMRAAHDEPVAVLRLLLDPLHPPVGEPARLEPDRLRLGRAVVDREERDQRPRHDHRSDHSPPAPHRREDRRGGGRVQARRFTPRPEKTGMRDRWRCSW